MVARMLVMPLLLALYLQWVAECRSAPAPMNSVRPIYFHVYCEQPFTVQTGTSSAVYESVAINTGGAMNAASGVFRAPRNGSYFFHIQVQADQIIRVNLSVNGTAGRATRPAAKNTPFLLSETFVLKAGDQVQVQFNTTATNARVTYSHFLGLLL